MKKIFQSAILILVTTGISWGQIECVTPDEGNPPMLLSGDCGNYLNHIPHINRMNYSPEIVYRINIHLFRKSDGSGIYQPSQIPDVLQMVQDANQIINNLDPPSLPVSPPAINIPATKMRFQLMGIHWHDSDEYYEWAPTCSADMYNAFGINKTSEINVFYYFNPNTDGQGCGPFPYVNFWGNQAGFNWAGSQGLAHELGHVLGLPHTFSFSHIDENDVVHYCNDDIYDDTYHPDPSRGWNPCGPTAPYTQCGGGQGISNNNGL